MKQIIRYELEQGDEALIYSRFPNDGCEGCKNTYDCSGCSVDNSYYDNWIKKLKNAGVYELAKLANEYHRLYKEVEIAKVRMKAIEDEMRNYGLSAEYVVKYRAEVYER